MIPVMMTVKEQTHDDKKESSLEKNNNINMPAGYGGHIVYLCVTAGLCSRIPSYGGNGYFHSQESGWNGRYA